MTEIWLLYDSFTCMICYNQYSSSHRPIEICRNNHIICSVCLSILKQNYMRSIVNNLVCPFCKVTFDPFVKHCKRLKALRQATIKSIQKEKELVERVESYSQNNRILQQKVNQFQKKIKQIQVKLEKTQAQISNKEQQITKLYKDIKLMTQGINNIKRPKQQAIESLINQKDKRIAHQFSQIFALKEQSKQIRALSVSQGTLQMKNDAILSLSQFFPTVSAQRERFSEQRPRNEDQDKTDIELEYSSYISTNFTSNKTQKVKPEFRRHRTCEKMIKNKQAKEGIKKCQIIQFQKMNKYCRMQSCVSKQQNQ